MNDSNDGHTPTPGEELGNSLLGGPCRVCGGLISGRTDAGTTVTVRPCGHSWSTQESHVVAVVVARDASERDREWAKRAEVYHGQPAPFVLECNGEGDEVQINQAIQLAALDAELSRGVEWGGKP